MNKRSLISVILMIAIVSSLCVPTIAATNNSLGRDLLSNLQGGFDTLDYSQEEYLSQNVNTRSRSADSSEQIERLVVGFLASSKAYVRSPERYNNGIGFIAKSALGFKPIEYRLSETEYKRALNNAMGWEITSDNISFDNFIVDIRGNEATASIVEDYTYYITDGFASESFRRREYSFVLEESKNGWEIISVKTNDPWELENEFAYTPIAVEARIAEVLAEPQTDQSVDIGGKRFVGQQNNITG